MRLRKRFGNDVVSALFPPLCSVASQRCGAWSTPREQGSAGTPLGMATMVSRAGEGSTYMLEVASFDGTGQCIDAEAPQQDLGGESGLTVMSWVRRARTTSTDPRAIDCDRLIDFGNGQQKENIVINFKEGVRCD